MPERPCRPDFRSAGGGYAPRVVESQPRSRAKRTISTRLFSPSLSMARALKVSTVLTLMFIWAPISLFA